MLIHSQRNDTKRNSKVIFTDGITWFFLENSILKKRYDLGVRQLHRYINSKSKIECEFLGISWKNNEIVEVNDWLTEKVFGGGISHSKAPEVFAELVKEIKEFVKI